MFTIVGFFDQTCCLASVSCGSREAPARFKEELSNRFEIKTKVVGTGRGELGEARVLNRVIGVDETGWRYEPDQRHADIIVKGLGLKEAKAVGTPGEEEKKGEEEENEELLEWKQATGYRALAARANYSAQDRVDIQYAVKELSRLLDSPGEQAWVATQHLLEYVHNTHHYSIRYTKPSGEGLPLYPHVC